MLFFDSINILLLIVSFVYALFALLLIQKGRCLYAYFHLMVVLSVIGWTVGMMFHRSATEDNAILFWMLMYIGPVLIASFFYLFSIAFPDNKMPSTRQLLVVFFSAAIVLLLVVDKGKIVVDIEIVPGEENIVTWGKYYIVFFLHQVCFVTAGIWNLWLKYIKSRGVVRERMFYVFWGYVSSYSLALVTNLLIVWWGDFRFQGLGPMFSIFMLLPVLFSIVKHRLMGIRLLASRIYIYLIVAIFAYIYFQYMLYVHILVLSGKASLIQLTLFDLSSTVIFAVVLLPFLIYIQKSSDILFFKGQNPRRLIKDVSIRLSGVIDLRQLTIALNEEAKKLLGTDDVYIAIKDTRQSKTSDNITLLNAKNGKVKFIKEKISKEDKIFIPSQTTGESVISVESIAKAEKYSDDLLKKLSKYDVEVAAPLVVHRKIVGYLLLSSKVTQEVYSREDAEFIEIIASQVAIAVENAKLYNEVKIFNRRLRMEIRSAIEEIENSNNDLVQANLKLVRAYEKLHKLDRAKSEFLSIASHQLRTPLTSIKGFTSLLMEGTYGKISKQVEEILNKVFTSNERLIHLVEDLLNISRIESGRFVFDLKGNKIQPLLEQIIDSFAVPVKNKKLKLEYHPPKKEIPPFVFDKNKIQELFSNLIDNAIKYTHKGTIKVSLSLKGTKVLIKIKDSGMGIPKGETEYIFDKFQRGKGVNQVHTEGVGLGLYVCRKVVEAHKGKIWAESAGVGKGSTFFVELKTSFKPVNIKPEDGEEK